MKKKDYCKPSCQIVALTNSQLICTSNGGIQNNSIRYYDKETVDNSNDVW